MPSPPNVPGERPAAFPGDARDGTSPWPYLAKRTAVAVLTLAVAASVVFFAIHLGPRDPADATVDELFVADEDAAAQQLEQRKARFGLDRPLAVQYGDYLADVFTLDFGESWASRWADPTVRAEDTTDINTLIFEDQGPRTLWLWFWTLVIATLVGLPVGVLLGFSRWSWSTPGATISGALVRAAAVFLLVGTVGVVLQNSETFLLGFDWKTFLVDSGKVNGAYRLGNLTDPHAFLVAAKHAFPAALALASGVVGTVIRVGERAVDGVEDDPRTLGARARGLGRIRTALRCGARRAALPLTSSLSANAAVLVGGTLIVESQMGLKGIGQLFAEALGHGDYTTVQAVAFVFFLVVVGARLLEDVAYVALVGVPEDRDERASANWTGVADAWGAWGETGKDRLSSLSRYATTDRLGRLRATPRPALAWIGVGLVLFALQAGAVIHSLSLLPWVHAATLPDLPTLLSRDLWPNLGHRTPGGGWTGTAFGLPAAYAWGLRVALTYAYALSWAAWLWVGYRTYRTTYREADRTPVDAALSRFADDPWGRFGLVVVFAFLVAAVFAPTLGATTFDRLDGEQSTAKVGGETTQTSVMIQYLDDESGEVRSTTVTLANLEVESNGVKEENVGPMQYDEFDRFHPFGTSYGGTDLFTLLVRGSRTYLLVGAVTSLVALSIAFLAGTLSVGLRGPFETGSAVAADATAGLPMIPVALLVVDQFEPVIEDTTVGTLAMAGAFGVLAWPMLWRTIRTPLARAADAGWVDAARGFDEPRRAVARRHVLTRVAGHLLAYLVLTVLGSIVAYTTVVQIWGSSVSYVMPTMDGVVPRTLTTVSWHNAVVPAVVLLVLMLGFVALADGIRSAVDPTGREGIAAPGETVAAGGAG